MQRRRSHTGARRGDARVPRVLAAPPARDRHRRRRRAGAQHRARHQPLLPRAMERGRVRVGSPLRVAGAHHARRADRLGDLGAAFARHARARAADGARLTVTVATDHPGAPAQAPASSSVGRFVLRTLGWLPILFGIWYFAAPLLLAPAVLIVRAIARAGLPDIIGVIEQSGAIATFVTTLRSGGAS